MFAHHDPNSNTHAGDSVGNNNNSHMKDDKQMIPVVTKKKKTTTKGQKRKTSSTTTSKAKAKAIARRKSTRVKREVVDDEHKTITTPTTKIEKDAVAPSTPVSKKRASKTSPSTSISTPKKRTPIKPKSSSTTSTTISTPKKKTTKKKKKTTTKTSSSRKRKRIEQGSLKPPRNWETIYSIVTELRADKTAPLDYDGGAAIPERHRGDVIYRYQVLTALMLSSQTKDKVVGDAICALQSYRGDANNNDNDDHNSNHNGDVIGLDVQSIMNMDVVVLKTLIGKVGFYNNKAKYMKSTAEILLRDYDGDIPSTAEGMIKLSGVGPKMVRVCICMFIIIQSICIDT